MEGLREELVERTRAFMKDYIALRLDRTNYFRSMGQARIHFAKEEPNLFKMYFLRRRQDISSLQELYTKEGSPDMGEYLSQTLQISPEKAMKQNFTQEEQEQLKTFYLHSGLDYGEMGGTDRFLMSMFRGMMQTEDFNCLAVS